MILNTQSIPVLKLDAEGMKLWHFIHQSIPADKWLALNPILLSAACMEWSAYQAIMNDKENRDKWAYRAKALVAIKTFLSIYKDLDL